MKTVQNLSTSNFTKIKTPDILFKDKEKFKESLTQNLYCLTTLSIIGSLAMAVMNTDFSCFHIFGGNLKNPRLVITNLNNVNVLTGNPNHIR